MWGGHFDGSWFVKKYYIGPARPSLCRSPSSRRASRAPGVRKTASPIDGREQDTETRGLIIRRGNLKPQFAIGFLGGLYTPCSEGTIGYKPTSHALGPLQNR